MEYIEGDGRRHIAVRIQRLPDMRDIEITGTIRRIDGSMLLVSRVKVHTDRETEVFDENGEAMAFDELRRGMVVSILATRKSNREVLAKRIHVLERIENEVAVTGLIEALDQKTLVVLGRTFYVTDHTRIFDAAGDAIRFGDLAVGQTVAVRGEQFGDHLVAFVVRQKDQAATDITIEGPLEAVGDGTLKVLDIIFFVDAATAYFDVEGNAITKDDLVSGQTVSITAVGQANGTRLAVEVRVAGCGGDLG